MRDPLSEAYIAGFVSVMEKRAGDDSDSESGIFGLGPVASKLLPWAAIPLAFWAGGNAGRYGNPNDSYLKSFGGNVMKFLRSAIRPQTRPFSEVTRFTGN